MTSKTSDKVFHILRAKILTIIAVAMLAPTVAFATAARQENINAVNALANESKRYNLSQLYFEGRGKELLFIGTNHTFTPGDPQIAGVEAFFKAFEPTLVLIEGGDWAIADSKEQAVSKYGEMGFTRFLAAKANIKAMSADAPEGETIAAGLKEHTATDTKLYFALRVVPQWAKQATGKTVEENMRDYLASPKFNSYFPPNTLPQNIEELQQQLAKRIPTLKDWKSFKYNWAFDGGDKSFLNEVDTTVNNFRNNYFKDQIFTGLRKGERVFVIAGYTHLGKIAPLFSQGLPAELMPSN